MNSEDEEFEILEIVEIPIDGVLDLHTFRPSEVKILLPEYLSECRKKEILDVRIIHGKGTGVLQRKVHSILSRLPEIASFGLAGHDAGGWGATLVRLHPLPVDSSDKEKKPT